MVASGVTEYQRVEPRVKQHDRDEGFKAVCSMVLSQVRRIRDLVQCFSCRLTVLGIQCCWSHVLMTHATYHSSSSHFYEPYGQFPRVSLHVFDAVTTVTTFVLEVVLRGKGREFGEVLQLLGVTSSTSRGERSPGQNEFLNICEGLFAPGHSLPDYDPV